MTQGTGPLARGLLVAVLWGQGSVEGLVWGWGEVPAAPPADVTVIWKCGKWD